MPSSRSDIQTPDSASAVPVPGSQVGHVGLGTQARGFQLSWADGAALLAVLAWGANFPIQKQLMTVLEPLSMMAIRNIGTAALFALILAISGRRRLPERADWRTLLVVSLVGLTLNAGFYSYGLHLTTASHSGLIFTITPLFVFGLSYAMRHLKVDRVDVLGLGLGLLGAVLIVGAPVLTGSDSGGATLIGDLLTCGAALTWGLWTILAAPLLRRYGTLAPTAWITIVGTLALVPIALPGLLAEDWSQVTWPMIGAFVYSCTAAGVVGGLLWYGAVRRIGAARTAIYANMESFFVVIFAAILLSERVEWTALLGGVAVVGGVLLTRRGGAG
jgi:drug/metabolite transporter (DMT)-like permease